MTRGARYKGLREATEAAKQPLISVIIPTYNRAADVVKAIRSVSEQTYKNIEIIVVDDGSSDGTIDVLKKAQKHETRLKIIQQENAGVSAARNHGVRESKGEYIAFLDSDDVWKPEKLAVQLAEMQRAPAGRWLCLSNVVMKRDGREEDARKYPDDLFDPEQPLALDRYVKCGFLVLPTTWMLRRDTFDHVGGFDENLSCVEDGDFVARMLRLGGGLLMANKCLATYNIPDEGKIRTDEARSMKVVVDRHLEWLKASCPSLASLLQRRANAVSSKRKKTNGWKSSLTSPSKG